MSDFEFGLAEKKYFDVCGVNTELKLIDDKFIEARIALDEKFPIPRDKGKEKIFKSDLANLWADFHISDFKPFEFGGKVVEYSVKNARLLVSGELFEREMVGIVTNRQNFSKKINIDFEFTKKK